MEIGQCYNKPLTIRFDMILNDKKPLTILYYIIGYPI